MTDLAQAPHQSGTSSWLLAYSIGPVADFILAAQRMGDFWTGSRLLSQVCSQGVQALRKKHPGAVQVIFPGLPVEPSSSNERYEQSAAWPNRGVLIWSGSDPTQASEDLTTEFREALRTQAALALDLFIKNLPLRRTRTQVRHWVLVDLFHAWIDSLLEIHVAWQPLPEAAAGSGAPSSEAWRSAYRSTHKALLARKRTHDFRVVPKPLWPSDPRHPRSSLDGGRPAVLTREYLDCQDLRRHRQRWGVQDDALGAPGLVKRVLGRRLRLPAITRIALTPWVDALEKREQDAQAGGANASRPLSELEDAYETLARLLPDQASASRWHARLQFDGQLLLEDRLLLARATVDAEAAPSEQKKAALHAFDALGSAARAAAQALGEPVDPYVGILAADIDRFGDALWNADRNGQIELAALASRFAESVSQWVRDAGGVVLYAGGDESLALVPRSSALPLARRLAEGLAGLQPNVASSPATLSVGVALVHALTPLHQMHELALRARARAKRDESDPGHERDALAVLAVPRAGEELWVRLRWDDCHRLDTWLDALRSGALPRNSPYEFHVQTQLAGRDDRMLRAALARFAERREGSEDAVSPAWAAEAFSIIDTESAGGEAARRKIVAEWRLMRWLTQGTGIRP